MPVIAISSAPDRSTYDKVSSILDLDERPATGLLVHSAGELDTGEVRIVQVFESGDAMQQFAERRLFPAFEQAGVEMDLSRAPVPVETFHHVTGGAR